MTIIKLVNYLYQGFFTMEKQFDHRWDVKYFK